MVPTPLRCEAGASQQRTWERLVERSTLPKTKMAMENPWFEDQVPHVFFRASTCTGKSQNIPSSHPCIVYLHLVELMEDTGNYANIPYMDGMDYRYIKTLQEGTGSMPNKACISTSLAIFFLEAINPPAALPAKRPFLELLTAARLLNDVECVWQPIAQWVWIIKHCETLGVHWFSERKHLIFSCVMMGHEGSTAQFTWKSIWNKVFFSGIWIRIMDYPPIMLAN